MYVGSQYDIIAISSSDNRTIATQPQPQPQPQPHSCNSNSFTKLLNHSMMHSQSQSQSQSQSDDDDKSMHMHKSKPMKRKGAADVDSSLRFLRTTEGIVEATREIRHCIKVLKCKQKSMHMQIQTQIRYRYSKDIHIPLETQPETEVIEKLARVILILNTSKDRFTKDTTISAEAMYIHRRTKRMRPSLIDQHEHEQETKKLKPAETNKIDICTAATVAATAIVASEKGGEPLQRFATAVAELDPEPSSGGVYTLEEAVAILKHKKTTTATIKQWKKEGKILVGIAKVQQLVREAKDRDFLMGMSPTTPVDLATRSLLQPRSTQDSAATPVSVCIDPTTQQRSETETTTTAVLEPADVTDMVAVSKPSSRQQDARLNPSCDPSRNHTNIDVDVGTGTNAPAGTVNRSTESVSTTTKQSASNLNHKGSDVSGAPEPPTPQASVLKPNPQLAADREASNDTPDAAREEDEDEDVVYFDQIDNPLDKDGRDPPPSNGTHYDMFEAISILKFKKIASKTVQQWTAQGKIKCTEGAIYYHLAAVRTTNIMPKRVYFGGRGTIAYDMPPNERQATKPPLREDDDDDPEPANGEWYETFEAVAILKSKRFAAKTMQRWIKDGKVKCSGTTLYKHLGKAKTEEMIPKKGTEKGGFAETPKETKAPKKPPTPMEPPEIDNEEDDPEPANGTHYCLHEIVTFLLTKKKFSKTTRRWIETKKILCSKWTVYRAMTKATKKNVLPRKGDYGNVQGNRSIVDVSKVDQLVGLATSDEIKAKLMEIQKQELEERGLPLSRLTEPTAETIKNYRILAQSFVEGEGAKIS